MSIVAFPSTSCVQQVSDDAELERGSASGPSQPNDRRGSCEFVRRRGSLRQGRALETLGHAVEYLVDQRMFDPEGCQRDEEEAVQILMRMSRAVFAECPEVITLRRRLSRWVHGRRAGDGELQRAG